MRINKKAVQAVVGLSAVLLSGNVLAWQTLVGTNVTFQYDESALGLYGTPTVSGNSLVFTPTSFKAESINGAGFGFESSTINVKIYANQDFNLSAFNLTEQGDYSLIGSDAQVTVGGQIRLFDLNNAPPAGPQLTDLITATDPLTVTTTLANYQTTNWQANAAIAVPTNWSSGVNLTIENILLASTTQLGSEAFIEKKTVVITAVPEAQTYAMMLAGLGLVGFMARRARMIV